MLKRSAFTALRTDTANFFFFFFCVKTRTQNYKLIYALYFIHFNQLGKVSMKFTIFFFLNLL